MVSRLVKKVGPYTITQDERGVYSLLDPIARVVSCGPDIEAMESAASLFCQALKMGEGPKRCRCGRVHEGAIITDSHSCLFPVPEAA